MIVHDLLRLADVLEDALNNSAVSLISGLRPHFSLVGSAAEGTAVGIGNEIDLTMNFAAFEVCTRRTYFASLTAVRLHYQ